MGSDLKICPHCGQPMKDEAKKGKVNAWGVIFFMLVILGGIIWYAAATGPANLDSRVELIPTPTAQLIYSMRYRVEGTAPRASITLENAQGNTEQAEVNVPWESPPFDALLGQFVYISAQNETDRGNIKCSIVQDGVTLERAESSGAYAIATCSGSVGR